MLRLPTCLLLHETTAGRHYDWLLADPARGDDPTARLWTARVAIPTRHWLCQAAFLLEPIAPHRRHYLTYQGPLSDRRGSVRRVDAGWFLPRRWTESDALLDLHTAALQATVRLRRLDDHRWQAHVTTLP